MGIVKRGILLHYFIQKKSAAEALPLLPSLEKQLELIPNIIIMLYCFEENHFSKYIILFESKQSDSCYIFDHHLFNLLLI